MSTSKSNIKSKESKTKNTSAAKRGYLTKKMLLRASKAGVAAASRATLDRMGFTVIAEGGWVIEKHADGQIIRLHPLEPDSPANYARLTD